jgi:hypothetical protein
MTLPNYLVKVNFVNMNFLPRVWFCMGLLLWPLTGTPNSSSTPTSLLGEPASLLLVRDLMQAGRLAEAGQEIALQLQRPSPDPQFQLLQCVVLANQNQTAKAITCLNALVKAQPYMLEAYNNLGVLHASLGQHDEARRWLNLALQRVPVLWTVHQNIQNLQVEVSLKAYAGALQSELPLKAAAPKLTLLASTSLSNMANITFPPTTEDKVPPTAQDKVPPTAADKVEAVASAAPAPPVQALKPKPATAEMAEQAPLDEETRLQVQAAIEAWAGAWSAQNMPAYFAAYTPDFSSPKGLGRAAWEAERTSRIAGRRFVRVSVRQLSFEKVGAKVVARFSQFYESDNISSTHRKRLDLVRHEGGWRIERENVIAK